MPQRLHLTEISDEQLSVTLQTHTAVLSEAAVSLALSMVVALFLLPNSYEEAVRLTAPICWIALALGWLYWALPVRREASRRRQQHESPPGS